MLTVSFKYLVAITFVSLGLSYPCDAKTLKVVTTVAPITNMVQKVGGDLILVSPIIPEGVNSHTYGPIPSDAKTLNEADLIIANGLGLETSILKLATNVKHQNSEIVRLGDLVLSKDQWRFDVSFPKELGKPNPHLWPNVGYTIQYVLLIRDYLIKHDGDNREKYMLNTSKYLAELQQLDNTIAKCISTIPLKNRKLITYHDSFAYFGSRYGLTVIDAIQPADFREPSAKEVARLIKQLRGQNVHAVFGSVVFPSSILEQIAREANVQFINGLRDDALPGKIDDPEHSYIGMMLRNTEIITQALEGDLSCLLS